MQVIAVSVWGCLPGGALLSAHPGVLDKVLEDLPAPVLVLLILGEPVEVEEALHRLWP